MDVIQNGSDEAHALFLREQGVYLALFVDGIIGRYSLQREGGIALVAWSMGNLFALSILDSLRYLSLDTKTRLSACVHTYIAWGERSIYYLNINRCLSISDPNYCRRFGVCRARTITFFWFMPPCPFTQFSLLPEPRGQQ